MNRLIITLFTLMTIVSANIIDINLENKNEKFQDFIFKEAMNDANASGNNYENLSKTKNNININISTNYKEMIGFNYSKSLSGITYDEKELYIGNPSMKYFSYSKITKDVDYGNRDTKKDISKMTVFHIFDISKEQFSSITNEVINADKLAAIPTATSPADVHRNYTKEVFIASSENLYDIAKQDAKNGEEYFQYGLFVKNITPKFKIYGVPIIGLVQYNYTDIENYVVDGNGTRRNLAYSTKIENDVTVINTSASDLKNKPNFNLQGKYQGYEYGFKVSASYQIKDFNIFLTLYNKKTVLNNKYKKDLSQTNINSTNNNVLEYRTLEIVQQYVNFGINYSF